MMPLAISAADPQRSDSTCVPRQTHQHSSQHQQEAALLCTTAKALPDCPSQETTGSPRRIQTPAIEKPNSRDAQTAACMHLVPGAASGIPSGPPTSLRSLPCSLASCWARCSAFTRHDTPAAADTGPAGPPDAADASAALRRSSSRAAAIYRKGTQQQPTAYAVSQSQNRLSTIGSFCADASGSGQGSLLVLSFTALVTASSGQVWQVPAAGTAAGAYLLLLPAQASCSGYLKQWEPPQAAVHNTRHHQNSSEHGG